MLRVLKQAALPARRQLLRTYVTKETTYEEEALLAKIRESFRTKSFVNPEKVDMSPELREKVNAEFEKFLNEFALKHDFISDINAFVGSMSSGSHNLHDSIAHTEVQIKAGNLEGFSQYPRLKRTEFNEPYSQQELFLRRLFHASQVAQMGAIVTDVYRPHEDRFKPPTIEKTSINLLIAAGAHLGHATSKVRANALPFVLGERAGIHIINLDQTFTHLRRASNVVESVSRKGGLILFVGTREGQERAVEIAADRAKGYYVHTRWIPGTLTNATNISRDWPRLEVDMADEPTGRDLGVHLQQTIVKPDLIVILNPVENRHLINECLTARIPTIGISDTDNEPSLLTYPIPGNDDSLRFTELVLGILSNAAKRGRDARVAEFSSFKKADELANSGRGFNKNEEAGLDSAISINPAEETLAAQPL